MDIIRRVGALGRRLLTQSGYRFVPASTFGIDLQADLSRICGRCATVVFDVGSYQGASVAMLRSAFPNAQIYGFEPYPPAYELAHAAHAADPLVRLEPYALGAHQDQQTLYCYRGSAANALLKPSAEAASYDYEQFIQLVGTQQVAVRTLESFCQEQHISAIDLLKIDTQGYEAHVLQGAGALLQTGAIAAILVEMLCVPYYQGQIDFADLYRLLAEHSYRLVDLYYPTRSPQGAIDCCVGLFRRA